MSQAEKSGRNHHLRQTMNGTFVSRDSVRAMKMWEMFKLDRKKIRI